MTRLTIWIGQIGDFAFQDILIIRQITTCTIDYVNVGIQKSGWDQSKLMKL